jgi:DNA-directed RNA polymerase subunit RPC12/RpoP
MSGRSLPEAPRGAVECPSCGARVAGDHADTRCAACGRPFPQDVQARLPALQAALNGAANRPRLRELLVDGRTVPCPVCGHDRFRTRSATVEGLGEAVLGIGLTGEKAVNYVCQRCGNVLWFIG